jgi:hypothetical protein
MATKQEIIEVIDAFLENRMTQREAYDWASDVLGSTPYCVDSAGALFTFVGSYVPKEAMSRPLREQLVLDKEVLIHGVPCPRKELGITVEAYSLVFSPWEKIALCQIKITESKERVLELMEEAWEGDLLFHEFVPLPIIDEQGPPLTKEDVWKKRDAYWSGDITGEEFLKWILDQLQRKNSIKGYESLLLMYWRLRRPDSSFTEEYTKIGTMKSWKTIDGKAPYE